MHIGDKICQEVEVNHKSANQLDIHPNTTHLDVEPNLAIPTNWGSDLDNFIAQ